VGAIVGGEPSPLSEGYLKQPLQDAEFITPARNAKEALPCFVGSRGRRRWLDEGLGERIRKKLLGLLGRRLRAEGVAPAIPQRSLRQHQRVLAPH
jgi:hypothetical protein